MRKQLKAINGQRLSFMATVERFGEKSAFRGPPLKTLLLKDVIRLDTGEGVCDHLWFTAGKSWQGLEPGDRVQFDARVDAYIKGYCGYRDDVWDKPIMKDYRLTRPTKVVCLGG